jgi:hypothetical protein
MNNVPAYFNASTIPRGAIRAAPHAASAASLATPRGNVRAAPIAASAASLAASASSFVRSNAIVRGSSAFPQPPLLPMFAKPAALVNFISALETTCLRSIFFRACSDLKDAYKCHPNQCRMAHLDFNEKICNDVVVYLRTHRESGIDCVDAFMSCPHAKCRFWPCNQKLSDAVLHKSVVTVVADPNVDFVPLVATEDDSLKLSAEKAEMQVSNPLLYAVWVRTYSNLPKAEFLAQSHSDYLVWNAVDTVVICGAKKDDEDREEAIVEVENQDHRREFADYLASILDMPISEDLRVLGTKKAMQIAHDNGDVFVEYIRAHWNFAGRPEVIGQIVTFHQWLNSHSKYSMIYRLYLSGQSWKDAKMASKGAHKVLATCESFDWDSAQCAVQTVSVADEAEEAAFAAKQEQMKALMRMTAADAVAVEAPQQRQYGPGKECVKVFLPSRGPSFLKGTAQSDNVFVCRHFKGAFEVYIKLAEPVDANDATAISGLWSQHRAGPGRASFVTAGREMFLCISGTIKKMSGFREMFEAFPGFIAVLQEEQYVANNGMCAVPVVMNKTEGAPYTYFASTDKKQCLMEQTEAHVEVVVAEVEESDDESDDDCNRYDLGSGNIQYREASTQDAGSSFDFAEASDEAADEPVSRYETDAYSLVDILVHYFKK